MSSQQASETRGASSADEAAMERMHSHLSSSTSETTTFPNSAQDYTLHEKVGKGSSSTVRVAISSPQP